MRNYELTLLLKADLIESALQELLGEITSLLQNEGALVMSQDSKGKRLLKASINKQQEAELAVIKLTLDPAKLDNVTKNLKAKEGILRFALLSYIPRKAKERTTIMQPALTPAIQETKTTEATEEEKVELGDIDKKLEEIFKEENL